MKKHLILFFTCFTIVCIAQKRNVNIGILVDNRNEKLDNALLWLQKQIKAVVGEDAIIKFPANSILVNNYDQHKAEQNYTELSKSNTDIILAFGAVNNKVISNRQVYKKPTILFGAINTDFNNIDLSKKTSGIKNFTYLIITESYSNDFKIFKELTQFKTLGIVVKKPLADLLSLKETFDKEFKSLEADYKLIPFNSVSDITSHLDGVDAIYMSGGLFLKDEEVRLLARTFIEKQLPSFTNLGVHQVREGIMATNRSDEDFNQFVRRVALSIEDYINGTPLSDMPVLIEYNPRLTINYYTAKQVKIPIKYSLITSTDFVGGTKKIISKDTYNLLEVVDSALQKNLSLQSQQKSVELQSQKVKSEKSNYIPSITASGTATYLNPKAAEISLGSNPEFSTNGNITLQQTIFSATASANIAIQKKRQQAQQEDFNTARLDIIFSVVNAYFNVLILKTNVQIQLRNLALTKRNFQIAHQNFVAGESGESDELRFRSQMAQNTQGVVEAVNQLQQSFVVLNQLLNNPVETEIDIADATLNEGMFSQYDYDRLAYQLDDPTSREPFIAFLIQEAKRNAPELKAINHNIEANERNLKLNSGGRFWPTVALQGEYSKVFNRNGAGSTPPSEISVLNENYNVGINLSIPILNQNKTNINRQTILIQKNQFTIDKQNIELTIASNMRSGVFDVINQISNIELSKISEETAQRALELTQTSYASGAVSVIQLIDAQNNYLNAQLARATAVYNYLIKSLQVERFLGYYFFLNTQEDNSKFSQRFLEFLDNK